MALVALVGQGGQAVQGNPVDLLGPVALPDQEDPEALVAKE